MQLQNINPGTIFPSLGDMTKAIYDPTNVSGDAFDMDNMVEGTNKILTAEERVNIGINTDYYNGTFQESFNALVTSDGTTITMSLEQQGGGDLNMRFSDGVTALDCTPVKTIVLTAGTDTAPQKNYIYILQSTKVLTLSTSAWPTAEHIKVGFFFVQSAAFVNTANRGALINQNWNDHAANGNDMGHGAHIAEAIRMGTGYFSGIDGNGTSEFITITTNIGVPDGIHFKTTSGFSYQLHKHAVPAKDTSGTDVIHVVNDNTTPYTVISSIADALTDSAGGSLSGKYYSVIVGVVANKTGEYTPLMLNLPSGSYSNQTDAIADVDSYDNYTAPREFNKESTTAIFIARLTFKHSTSSGGTWTLIETQDLRGGAGGGGSSSSTAITEFSDGQFTWFNSADITKIVDVDLSGLTTGIARTIVMADSDVDLGDIITNNAKISYTDSAAVALNTAKVTNATHTGEVTGSTALIMDKTAITNKTLVTGIAGDFILVTDGSDADNLKKVNLSDLLGGGGATQLSDLSDVVSATNTNRFALMANGTTGYVGRALVEADISDLGTYSTDIHSNITALDAVTGTNTGDEVSATTTVEGVVELATSAELDTGTDTTRAVTSEDIKTAKNVPHVVPGTSGNVLTSDGTDWTSAAAGGGGGGSGFSTFDLRAYRYENAAYHTDAQDGDPRAVAFKTDGTKMYILGSITDDIFQYSLSTAWDITTATYDSKSFSFNGEDDTPGDIYFKSDGTKMYMVGNTNNKVYQYTITSWDVSTASYDSVFIDVTSQESAPTGLTFNSDGTKMYICGGATDSIYQYSMTAWDLSTASYDTGKTINVNTLVNFISIQSIAMNDDGTIMYVSDSSSDAVAELTLSTAYDISTATYAQKMLFNPYPVGTTGLFMQADGGRLFVAVGVSTGINSILSFKNW